MEWAAPFIKSATASDNKPEWRRKNRPLVMRALDENGLVGDIDLDECLDLIIKQAVDKNASGNG